MYEGSSANFIGTIKSAIEALIWQIIGLLIRPRSAPSQISRIRRGRPRDVSYEFQPQ